MCGYLAYGLTFNCMISTLCILVLWRSKYANSVAINQLLNAHSSVNNIM